MAQELAQKKKNQSKYTYWNDKDVKAKDDLFNSIPKHFYTNYKTNMMRDAHYMAKAIAGGALSQKEHE